jgi:hypothetical protein
MPGGHSLASVYGPAIWGECWSFDLEDGKLLNAIVIYPST